MEKRPLQKIKRRFDTGTDRFDRESSIFRLDLFVDATVHSQCLLSLTTRISTGKERMKVSRKSKSKLDAYPKSSVQLIAERPVITAEGTDSSAARKKRKEDAEAPIYIKRI
jgi:hypothetical protein